MKRIFFMLVTCCFFAAQGFGQGSDDNSNAPEITFEKTVHDFGTVSFNGVAEFEFVFTNTGKEPLVIQNCQTTCGCTVPTCPNNSPIKPGEKGTVKVKYSNTHIEGLFNRQVSVITNARNSIVRLTVKGEVSKNTVTAKK